jgi:hypothetical protein
VSSRDRIVLMVIAVAVVAVGGWMLVVSPKKKEVKTYEEQVATAQTQLSSAQSQLADAKAAQAQYATAYASVVNLGKAVPPSQEVASLVYELEAASNAHSVSFNSIVTGNGSGGPAPAPAAAAAATAAPATSKGASTSPTAASAEATAAAAAFTQMPFTFVFDGGFFSLEHLFRGLTGFTTYDRNGTLQVSGRLLTVQSVKLTPEAGANGTTKLNGTVTATAYVLPAGQGLTAGATPSSPTGTTSATSASASPTTAPAVVTP